jgi:mitochondrial fission protein ELM1
MSIGPDRPVAKVWALLGRRAGDNAQILALAEALGYRLEQKQLRFNRLSGVPNVLLGASLINVAADSRRLLRPPWPDAIISAGKRSVPVARWARERSGGATRLIHIGRPWGPPSWFDLVVTTAQYGLGAGPNIIQNLMPLLRPLAHQDDIAATRWAPRFAHLPRPWIAVLVGGSTRPHVLDVAATEELARTADAAAKEARGSLLVTFGWRASAVAAAAFRSAITRPAYIHVMQADGSTTERNPYRAYLGVADRFIVTGDSASMVAEAARSGKPVEVFPIPKQMDLRSALGDRVWKLARREGATGRACRRLLDSGIVTSVRDLDRYHKALRDAGMLDGGDLAAKRQAEELAHVVARSRALIQTATQERAR